MTYFETVELRDAARAAYLKSLEALRYQVGEGAAARMLERNRSEQLKAELLAWDRAVDTHPDNPTRRNVRRVRYIRAI